MPESSKNGQAISKIVPAKITNVDTMMAQIRKAFEKRDPQLLARWREVWASRQRNNLR
jgi:hypothetical protein